MKIQPKHFAGLAVFAVSFVILLATIDDYGTTWDEPYYIAHTNKLQQWFGLLISNQSPFSDDAIDSCSMTATIIVIRRSTSFPVCSSNN